MRTIFASLQWGGVGWRLGPGPVQARYICRRPAVAEAESDELKDSDKESAGFIY